MIVGAIAKELTTPRATEINSKRTSTASPQDVAKEFLTQARIIAG